MRHLPASFQAHLDSGTTTLCFCWIIRRRDGVVLGFTDHDRPLTVDTIECHPDSGFEAGALATSADLAVDNAEIEGLLDHGGLTEADILRGLYHQAVIEVWRVNWRAPQERVLLRTGTLGEVTRGQHQFTAEIRGLSQSLDQPVGRLYQRQCDANVGDDRCGVNLDLPIHRGTGVIISVHDDTNFDVEGLDNSNDDWFTEGLLTWTPDESTNAGSTGFVKSFSTNSGAAGPRQHMALWQPPDLPLQVGDRFSVTVGCDRRAETCRNRFGNIANFRGFHLMPGNDFIISYPLRTERNDGGKR